MNRIFHRIGPWLALALLLSFSVPVRSFAADKRFLTEKDLFKFVWIADPEISPDGSKIVFTKVWIDPKTENYETALWIVPTSGGEARPLSNGVHDASPRWSPDGKLLAFVRSPMKDGKPDKPQIFLLSFAGGEAQQLTKVDSGASQPQWSPNGKTILFSSTDEGKDESAGKAPEGEDEGKPKEHKSDVLVINKAVYRFNGAGYINLKARTHLWTIGVPDDPGAMPKAKQITNGKYNEEDARWQPDGSRIYFTANRVAEPYYQQSHTDLYSIAPDGTDEKKVLSFDGGMRGYEFSDDGKQIAFEAEQNHHPEYSYTQPDLFVVDNQMGATPKNLTADYDYEIGGGIGGDQAAPRGGGAGGVIWSKDGRWLYLRSAEKGSANLKKVDSSTGKLEPLTNGTQAVMSYTASDDASKIALVISTSTNIGDLFVLDTASGNLNQLTHINGELFSQINITDPEEIWYTSFDGKKIQGWIQKPPNFDPSKKYPLILEIHGGPHGAYGFIFTHEFQWMAAKGYVVLYVNPRGSTSYGQDFGNIIQYHYPGDDYKDLMAGVDEVIKRGYIDTSKMGVTGGSGGGVLTNWTVGHTTRFAAAVSQRSIADWAGFWYTADFSLFTPSWFRAAPWEDMQDFVARSPITYIKNVKTPMMFIEGQADMRTPPADGGEQMFRALKYMHIPTVMCRFPGETHELSRSGGPWHRVERLQHIVNWFDIYLQGKPLHIYDVE